MMEVTIDVFPNEDCFWWRIECAAPSFYVVGDERYDTPDEAVHGARGLIRELSKAALVEVERKTEEVW